jgi:hypothetical protein
MPFLLAKIGTGKQLGFVLLAWVVFFLLAALVLPPLDSHLQPARLVYWSFVILAVLFILPTAIIVPAYVYQSWRRLPTVSNRAAYALWVSLESLLFLAILIWLVSLVIGALFGG